MKRFQSVKAGAEGHFTTMSSIARVILKEPATDFSSYDSVCVCALCDPIDYSTPGSSVHGILQARRLEWVAISSSRDPTCVSYVFCISRWILYPPPPGKLLNDSGSLKCLRMIYFGLKEHFGKEELRSWDAVDPLEVCGDRRVSSSQLSRCLVRRSW